MNVDFSNLSSNISSLTSSLTLTSQPRGLHNFITDIRNSISKEDEKKRIEVELANIRKKFSNSSSLSSYQKKKYVWKMCYIYVLGYDIDFGHLEFISLLSSTKYSEKAVGYMAVSLLLRPGDQLFTLVINSVRNDLKNQSTYVQSLALSAISNINGTELTEALTSDVSQLLVSPMETSAAYTMGANAEIEIKNKAFVCKKASLALLSFYRVNNECIDVADWLRKLSKILEDRDLGVVTSGLSLLLELANSSNNTSIFDPLVPYVVSILTRLVVDKSCPGDYLYYKIPSPWLQVKCLRFLQLFPVPESNSSGGRQDELLYEVLTKIFSHTDMAENANKSNAEHAILFETINLIISYGNNVKLSLRDSSLSLLGKFITVKDSNIRYLGLDALTKIARLEGSKIVQEYQYSVIDSLKDIDISVKKRALELLYVMVDNENCVEIVGELVTNLSIAENNIKEDYVVKIAILAEKYTTDFTWYLDTLCKVLLVAGEYVAEAIWYRMVQIVINHVDIHPYAANKMFDIVSNKYANEISIALAAYLLGEIGENIFQEPGKSGYDQFIALQQHFNRVSIKVQAIILTTYVKFINLYPDTDDVIKGIFQKYSLSSQLELQQRSVEYLILPNVNGGRSLMESVLETMPGLSEEKSVNALYSLLNKEKENDKEKEKEKNEKEKVVAKVSTSNVNTNANTTSNKANETLTKTPSVKEANLLSLDEDDVAQVNSSTIGIPGSISNQNLKSWFNNSLLSDANEKVILYDDEIITLSISSEYRFHQGRLSVYVANKTGAVLSNLSISIPTYPHLAIKVADYNNSIDSSNEIKVLVAVQALRPYDTYPNITVSFNIWKSPYSYTLDLPVVITNFFEAIVADKETYLTRWKSITGENLESQEVFNSNKPVTSELVNYIRSKVFTALHIGVAQNLDGETTATGSASYRTGSATADGNLIAVGVMLRLEGDVNQHRFRLTIRAKHALVVQGLRKLILGLLAKE